MADPYLRILRHLEQSPPCEYIIRTFDIFSETSGQIYLVQEWAEGGNAMAYLNSDSTPKVDERQMCKWGQHLHSAMSFLGSKGIAHRAIYPKHFLLVPRKTANSSELVAKLSGFRDAVIYWDPLTESVIPQPCKSLDEASSFHAPESFGSKEGGEHFDPVSAEGILEF